MGTVRYEQTGAAEHARSRHAVFLIADIRLAAELLGERLVRSGTFEVVGIETDGRAGYRGDRATPDPYRRFWFWMPGRAMPSSSLRGCVPTIADVRVVAFGLDEVPAQAMTWAASGAMALIGRSASLDELLSILRDSWPKGTSRPRPALPRRCSPAFAGSCGRIVEHPSTSLTTREREVAVLAGRRPDEQGDRFAHADRARHRQEPRS